MSYPILPKRVFRSPLIEFANFEDGTHVNLIRLIKPYANGIAYAVSENTRSPFCSNWLFKKYSDAKEKFELMVRNGSYESPLADSNYYFCIQIQKIPDSSRAPKMELIELNDSNGC